SGRGRGLTACNLQERQRGILRGEGVPDRRRVPVPGQQLVQPPGGMIGNAAQHVGEPGLRINTVELGGGDSGTLPRTGASNHVCSCSAALSLHNSGARDLSGPGLPHECPPAILPQGTIPDRRQPFFGRPSQCRKRTDNLPASPSAQYYAGISPPL